MFKLSKKIKKKLHSIFIPKYSSNNSGFSLVELVVVVGIVVLIAGVVLANHSLFNGGVVLESLSYEIALAIRQAQFFGINVRASDLSANNPFEAGYGVHFSTLEGQNKQFILFADLNNNEAYDSGSDSIVELYTITRGNMIKYVCVDSLCTAGSLGDAEELTITFLRPDPDANIKTNLSPICYTSDCSLAKVYVGSANERVRDKIINIGITGQISISTNTE